MFSVLPHSTFTVQILYKLYSLQLNCTYSNYTECGVTCSACYRTAYLLYKYCTNCSVCNWTLLTVITHKLLLLHVQLHNSTETVQLMSSEVQCCRLFDIVQSHTYPEIKCYTEIQLPENALSLPFCTRQLYRIIISGYWHEFCAMT